MGQSRWHRFAYRMERWPLARYWLLKDTGQRTRTGRAFTNRVNGHLVVIP